MKICITSTGSTLNSSVDPRFGRCGYFLIMNEKGKLLKALPNEGVQAMRGAGITAAQIVANEGIKVVITGNIGPNAYMVLEQSGIKIFPGAFNMTVEEAFEMYKQGKFKEMEPSQAKGFGPGFGRGARGSRRGFRRGQKK